MDAITSELISSTEGIESLLVALNDLLSNFEVIFSFFAVIVQFIMSVFSIVGVFITVAALIAAMLLLWLLEAIATYKLAKKLNYKYAALAWIPFRYVLHYVQIAMVGDKPFELFDKKLTVQNRSLTFLVYLGIDLFGSMLITSLIAILGVLPGIGPIISALSTMLYLAPYVAMAMMDFVYIKDIGDRFKADKQGNITASIVVVLLDNLATSGLARIVYLYTLLKKDPIPLEISDQK